MERKETILKNPDPPSNDLPRTGLLRLPRVLQFVPVSASTWWAGVKDGRFPKPMKLSERVTVWAVEDIRALIAGRYNLQKGKEV